jgi:hypothetical protein
MLLTGQGSESPAAGAFRANVRMLTMVIPSPARPQAQRGPPETSSLLALLNHWTVKKLLPIGSGPIPVDGSSGGSIAVDAEGNTVLALSLETVSPRASAQIADELDRLAQMNASDLSEVETQPPPDRSIAQRFTDLFGQDPPVLNRAQGALLVVAREPEPAVWRRLSRELGPRLRGVYRLEGSELILLPPPPDETRGAGPRTPVSWGMLLAVGVVVLGVGVTLLALFRSFNPATDAPVAGSLVPTIKTVATGVPGSASHTQWIGQQHLVHTSDGRLLALYAVPGGLQIVSDGGDNGATWLTPSSVTAVKPQSFSVAIDAADRLHVAYSDARGISYVVLDQSSSGWRASPVVKLDAHTKTPLVDVAWDQSRQVAHVVWAKDTSHGQEPYWAAIDSRGGRASVTESGAVAAPGKAVPVLVNDAVDPSSGNLLVTYRQGTSGTGWSSRTLTPARPGAWKWSAPERVPTDASIGAAALAFDGQGTAHLVLRDSTDYSLLYYIHTATGGWSKPEVAVQAHATSQVDFPALALDGSSKLVYLFFETDQFETAPEIRVAIRDPNSGWKEATSVAALPEGDYFPTALRNADGQAIALWTRGGSVPSLEAARVTSP